MLDTKYSPTLIRIYFMKISFVLVFLCMSFFLVSCKSKGTPTTSKPVPAVNFDKESADHIESLEKNGSAFKVGQIKDVTHYRAIELDDKTWCDFWVTTNKEIKNVTDSTVSIHKVVESEAWPENVAACPKKVGNDSDEVVTYKLSELLADSKEAIRFETDAKYRCGLMSECTAAKVISVGDREIEKQTYKCFVTDYKFKDNEEITIDACVSKRSIFEGVVEFKVINKADGKWIDKQMLNYSAI